MANEFKIKKGLIVTGASGGTVVDIQGSQGQLFSVTDDLSGSIFAVSDISGVPIFDVNSSGLSTFDGLVSGITPVNAANFVTKAYVDGSGGGTGPFLPLAGGTLTGDLTISKAVTPLFKLLDTTNNISLLLGADDANTFIRSSSSANLYLQPGGSTALTLLSGGNVGIGTTSPGYELSVNGNIEAGKNVFQDISSKGGFIMRPWGADYLNTTTNIHTGAIKITLPTGAATEDDMIKFTIDIYQYSANESLSVDVGGYVYRQAGINDSWRNVTAIVNAKSATENYTVRFGDDGTNHCVWVGELNTVWNHPNVICRNFYGGFAVETEDYLNEWDISFEATSFSHVSQTQSNNFPLSSGGIDGGFLPLSAGSSYPLTGDLYINKSVNGLSFARVTNTNTGTSANARFQVAAQSSQIDMIATSAGYTGVTGWADAGIVSTDSGASTGLILNAVSGEVQIQTAQTTALTISSGQNSTFAGNLTINGAVTTFNPDADSRLRILNAGTNAIAVFAEVGDTLYLGGNNTTGMTLDASANASFFGNVGIGVTSPNAKLSLAGGSNINSQNSILYIDTNSYYASSADRYITSSTAARYFQLNGEHIWSNAASGTAGNAISFAERMRIDSSGNVGIGTTSPGAKLDIINSGLSTMFRLSNTEANATTKYSAIVGRHYTNAEENVTGMLITSSSNALSGQTVSIGGGITTANAVNEIKFFTAANNTTLTGSERMRIDSAGNVGIGTNSPIGKLNIQQSTLDIPFLFSGRYNSENEPILQMGESTEFSGSSSYGELLIHSYNRDIVFSTQAQATFSNVDGSALIIEKGNGNVGIGTNSPSRKLVVSGAANAIIQSIDTTGAGSHLRMLADVTAQNVINWDKDTSLRFATSDEDWANYSERMRITGAGKVGIGTTNPVSGLQISTNTTGDANRNTATAGITLTRYISGTDYRGSSIFHAYQGVSGSDKELLAFAVAPGNSNSPFDFAKTKMVITEAGSVGIGTTTPNAKLDIQGTQGQLFSVTDDLSGSIFAVSDISGVPIFDVNSSGVSYFDGDVGIGTTSPGAKLEVFGTGNSLRLDSAANGSKEILFRNVGTGTATIKTDGDLKLFVEDAGKNILFSTTGGEKMRILANGNVGIGTTNPEYGLSVLTDDGGGVGNIVAYDNAPNAAGVGGGIGLGGYYNATQITPWAIIRAPKDTGGNGNFAGALTFSTRNSTSFNEAMRISSAGAIKFNAYGAGTLVTDASGNITAATSGPGTGSVKISGTPAIKQIAEWTSADTIKGSATLQINSSGTGVNIFGNDTSGATGILNMYRNDSIANDSVQFILGASTQNYLYSDSNSDAAEFAIGVKNAANSTQILLNLKRSAGVELPVVSEIGSDTDRFLMLDTSNDNLVKYVTGANLLSYIGGTGSSGVTSVATTSPILGGTITTSGTISLLQPASGARFRGVSVIGSDGLMEVGRYIDFHNSNTSTADFDVRLDCYSANNLRLTGSLNVTEKIVVNSQLGVGITPATGISLEVDGKIRADDSNSGDYVQMYCDGSVSGDSLIENTNSSIVIKSANATTRIDASGAAANLEVLNASNVATIRLRGAADSFIAGGDLGIGNTGPVSGIKLDVTGKVLIKTSDGVSDLYMGNYSVNKYVRFHTNNSNTYFDINCGHIYWRVGSSTKYDFDIANGNMQIDGTLTQSSDIRLKENITEIGDCISKVKAMRGVYYNKIESNKEDVKVGVIAQEVETVLPELISESLKDGFKSVAYSELTAVLINAIKEQQEIIEDLKTRITKLEN